MWGYFTSFEEFTFFICIQPKATPNATPKPMPKVILFWDTYCHTYR